MGKSYWPRWDPLKCSTTEQAEEVILRPVHWAKPRIIMFVGDLFGKTVWVPESRRDVTIPESFVEIVTEVMRVANWHVYLLVTNQSKRMRDFLLTHPDVANLDHVWWGVVVSNRGHLPRITNLQMAPVKNRALWMAPLFEDLGPVNLNGIGWVNAGGGIDIVGSPVHEIGVRSLRDQCMNVNVPFRFLYWGGPRIRFPQSGTRFLDGKVYDGLPDFYTGGDVPGRKRRAEIDRDLHKYIEDRAVLNALARLGAS